MTEFDLQDVRATPHYFEINLKFIRDNLKNHCEINKEDKKMVKCLGFVDECYTEDSYIFRDPVSIKLFDSEEELKEASVNIDEYITEWSRFSPHEEVVIIDIFAKSNRTVISFKSKREAEIWIEQYEKKEKQKHEERVKSDKLSQFFEYSNKWIPYTYDVREYSKDYWVLEYFKIGNLKRKLYTGSMATFDKWFSDLMLTENFDKYYYSIEIKRPPTKEGYLYVLELFSKDGDFDIDILAEQYCGMRPSCLFLLQYNFLLFMDTNEFLEYHLLNTFNSDKIKFKRFLKDALLEFEDEITFQDKHLQKLKNYINDNLQVDISTLITNKLTMKGEIIPNNENDLQWQGTIETEFVQFAYSLFHSKTLINRSNQIKKFVLSLAEAFNFTLGKNWESNHAKSINKTNNDYQPPIFEKLKIGYEKYANTIKNKKK